MNIWLILFYRPLHNNLKHVNESANQKIILVSIIIIPAIWRKNVEHVIMLPLIITSCLWVIITFTSLITFTSKYFISWKQISVISILWKFTFMHQNLRENFTFKFQFKKFIFKGNFLNCRTLIIDLVSFSTMYVSFNIAVHVGNVVYWTYI